MKMYVLSQKFWLHENIRFQTVRPIRILNDEQTVLIENLDVPFSKIWPVETFHPDPSIWP